MGHGSISAQVMGSVAEFSGEVISRTSLGAPPTPQPKVARVEGRLELRRVRSIASDPIAVGPALVVNSIAAAPSCRKLPE